MTITTSSRSHDVAAPGGAATGDSPARRSLEAPTDTRLVVARWFKFGMRRVYVTTADGRLVGWVDLAAGERFLGIPELATAFEAAIAGAQTDIPRPYRPRRAAVEAGASPGER